MSRRGNRQPGTVGEVNVERIWSAAELEALTPDERAAAMTRPIARVDPPFTLADAEHLRQLLEHGRTSRLADAPSITAERAEVLVGEVRAARRAR